MTIQKKFLAGLAGMLMALLVLPAQAQWSVPDVQEPSGEADIQRALSGGVPMGRWKEGLLFEGIEPMPWLKSAANWFPNTEEVQPNEMRIHFMGTAPMIRPGQMNTSIFVMLGNGDNFAFDLGEGSVAGYVASGIALNEIKKVFITHFMWTTMAPYPMCGCLVPGAEAGTRGCGFGGHRAHPLNMV